MPAVTIQKILLIAVIAAFASGIGVTAAGKSIYESFPGGPSAVEPLPASVPLDLRIRFSWAPPDAALKGVRYASRGQAIAELDYEN